MKDTVTQSPNKGLVLLSPPKLPFSPQGITSNIESTKPKISVLTNKKTPLKKKIVRSPKNDIAPPLPPSPHDVSITLNLTQILKEKTKSPSNKQVIKRVVVRHSGT